MLLEAIFALEKLSASRAGMRSESLVFASLSSYRVQQVNAKFEGCNGWPDVPVAMAEGENGMFDIFSSLTHVVVIAVVPLRSPDNPVKH